MELSHSGYRRLLRLTYQKLRIQESIGHSKLGSGTSPSWEICKLNMNIPFGAFQGCTFLSHTRVFQFAGCQYYDIGMLHTGNSYQH